MSPRRIAPLLVLLLAASPARSQAPPPPLTARELRESMLASDSIQVTRVQVEFAPRADSSAPPQWSAKRVSLGIQRGAWMRRFTTQLLPPGVEVHPELCPTPRALPGQSTPWMMSIIWINGHEGRGQVYVDLANQCGMIGLMGRQPVGFDVRPSRTDSLFALFQQALPADSALRVMNSPSLDGAAAADTSADVAPVAVVKQQPVYPDSLRKAGVEGTVMVRALVSPAGDVQDVTVSEGVFGLDVPAADAVRKWHFTPALHHGRPVASWVIVPVRFSLKPAEPAAAPPVAPKH